MERIAVTCGFKEIAEDGTIKYIEDSTDNGYCYKDMDAWKSGVGVIYISEAEFEGLADMTMDIDDLYTRESWIDEVVRYFGENTYPRAFYEYFAECVLQTVDWQCLTTLMSEWEDDIDEDYEYWERHIKKD